MTAEDNKEIALSKKAPTGSSQHDLLAKIKLGLNAVYAGRVPGIDNSYVQMECIIPWPTGMSELEASRSDDGIRATANLIQKGFDYAINGLTEKNNKFTIEVPVSHGLGGRHETSLNIFVYPPKWDIARDPEKIKSFLLENKARISERLRDFLTQQTQQQRET